MKLSVFDRIVTIVPGIDKNTSVDDVFEHVINGVRVLFLRRPDGEHDAATPPAVELDSTGLPSAG